MAIIPSTGKLRNKIESLWRVADAAWFGREVTGYDQIPNVLNGESLTSVNAAGTGTVALLGLTAGTNVVVAPSGLTVPAGQTFSNLGTSARTAVNGIVAHAGGGQATGTLIGFAINRVVTVATAGDSILLPASIAGASITLINAAAANALNLFPAVGEQINVLGVNAAFSLAANKTLDIYCAVAGTWNTILTA